MKRVEIIANQELLADFLDQMQKKLPRQYYTILNVMQGKGRRGEARGDSAWPERNFYCVMFVDEEETLSRLQKILLILRHDNPMNAFVTFVSEGPTIRLQDYLHSVSADDDADDDDETELENSDSECPVDFRN